MRSFSTLLPAVLLGFGVSVAASAQESIPPGFNTPIPESIMTPDELLITGCRCSGPP